MKPMLSFLAAIILMSAFSPNMALAAEWVKIVKPLPDVSTNIKLGDEFQVRNTMGSGDDKVMTIDIGGKVVAVKATDVEVVDTAKATLLEENLDLKKELVSMSKELEDARTQIKQLSEELEEAKKVEQSSSINVGILKPSLEALASSARVSKLMNDGKPIPGYLKSPLAKGSRGRTVNIVCKQIIDGSNMIAWIRYPRHAPTPHPGPGESVSQELDELVWLRGVDTASLIDGKLFWLDSPIVITGNRSYATALSQKTIWLMEPAGNDTAKNR